MQRGTLVGGLAVALLLLGPAPPACASANPTARAVTAHVLDSKSREPLPDVAVVSGPTAVMTDATGRFTLSVPHDSSLVMVQRIGYRPAVYRARPGCPDVP
jgi:hypothetical protein